MAEAVLDTRAEDAGSEAFPILAGNIVGKNKDDKKSAVTTPAPQSALDAACVATQGEPGADGFQRRLHARVHAAPRTATGLGLR